MVKLVTWYKRYILSFCVLFGCCLTPGKMYAFDYKSYSKEMRQVRSLTPTSELEGSVETTRGRTHGKKSKSKIVKLLVKKLFKALNNDTIPAKTFHASKSKRFSFYFKPAKVTKIGFKYRF